MNKEDEKITVAQCTEEVRLVARRLGLLHYYFSKAIVDKLGDEEGKALIKEAIWAYGKHCGRAVREGVEALGLPLTDENYGRVRDLPQYGWEIEMVTLDSGETGPAATFCPVAEAFKETEPRGQELGRFYCYVDQAKYEAYNPDMEFVHSKNVLDGDTCCEFLIQPRKEKD